MNKLTLHDAETNEEFINVNHLITLLRTLQYEKYSLPDYEREYICVEGVIDGINRAIECYNEGGYDV